MSEPKPAASLSPTLLARKGGARPAMRPQLFPIGQLNEATARQIDDDLGWNDMGNDDDDSAGQQPAPLQGGEVVSLNGAAPDAGADVPEVVRQQQAAARSVARTTANIAGKQRGLAAEGRRVAFTLRLDADRHLKLRLASTIDERSAQQIVTEALDRYLADMPEVASLAATVRKRGRT